MKRATLSIIAFAAIAGATSAAFAASPCDRCATDHNNDGSVNVADMVAFNADYFAGNSAADYNCDGSVNIADFSQFYLHHTNNKCFSNLDLDFDGDVDGDDVAIFDSSNGSLRFDFDGNGVTNALDRIILTTC